MPTLAKPGDPFIDTDGRFIEDLMDETTVIDDNALSSQTADDKRKILPMLGTIVVTKQLKIDNIPEPDKQQQTVICAVVGLKLLGLNDVDIADIANTSLDNIKRIVSSPAAQATFERMFQNIIHSNSETIQGRISAHAGRAVDVVTTMMEDTDIRDDVRLKAAQDVLDRSGTNADQFFSNTMQQGQSDDELRIVIMDEGDESGKVTVEVNKGKKG